MSHKRLNEDCERLQEVLCQHENGVLNKAAQAWSPCMLQIECELVDSAADVFQYLENTRSGWLTLTDRVLIRHDGQWNTVLDGRGATAPDAARDKPLEGAFCLGEKGSLALAHQDGDSWTFRYMSETLDLSEMSTGAPYLAREERFASVITSFPYYRIRSYWRAGEAGQIGYVPVTARFLGFERG